jgi:hypothetical protein
MPARSAAAAWMVSAALSISAGSTIVAQTPDARPLAGRRVVASYSNALDPSMTRPGASWTLAVPPALPCQLVAHEPFRPLLDQLWARSVTFRAQCRRLAGARAVVLLHTASAKETPWTAESRIGVLSNGRVMARVRVRAGRESVEVLAHELEHVIEQIDGVQLFLDVSRPGSGTTLAGGAFETRRATDAGRRAAKEVQAAQ